MPNPYPIELREWAVRAYEDSTDTYVEVAARFAIAVSTLCEWVRQTRDRHGHARAERRRLVLACRHRVAPSPRAGASRPDDGRRSLFPALARLERNGLITGEWRSTENSRRAKCYCITAQGRAKLKRETRDREVQSDAIGRVLRASLGEL